MTSDDYSWPKLTIRLDSKGLLDWLGQRVIRPEPSFGALHEVYMKSISVAFEPRA